MAGLGRRGRDPARRRVRRPARPLGCRTPARRWNTAAPGVYGVPDQWPHVRAAYERAGFASGGRVETVYLADVGDLHRAGEPPLRGLRLSRSVGINGTRLSAMLGEDLVGYIEIEVLEESERMGRQGRLADVGNLHVADGRRRCGVGTWLVAHAAEWLRLARVDRLLDYTNPDDEGVYGPFLERVGFRVLTRTERSWTRRSQ